jgi:hypothetical protein
VLQFCVARRRQNCPRASSITRPPGTNIDFVGKAIEAVSGKRLDAYLRDHIFTPLGMTDAGFKLGDAQRKRLGGMHARGEDGTLAAMPFELEQDPEFHMGGGGLYGTAGDYIRQGQTTSPYALAPFVVGTSTSTASHPALMTIAKRPRTGTGPNRYIADLALLSNDTSVNQKYVGQPSFHLSEVCNTSREYFQRHNRAARKTKLKMQAAPVRRKIRGH